MATSSVTDRLKSVREQQLKMTQEKVAAKLVEAGYEVTSATVMRYEGGKREAPTAYVEAFARLAGVDPVWLLFGKEATGAPLTAQDIARLRDQVGEAVERMGRVLAELNGALGVSEPAETQADRELQEAHARARRQAEIDEGAADTGGVVPPRQKSREKPRNAE